MFKRKIFVNPLIIFFGLGLFLSASSAQAYFQYDSQFGSNGSGNGQFNYPLGIAFDTSGSIYVVDGNNNRVQKFNSSGVYQSQFGTPGSGDGQFSNPRGIALDSSDNIYVVDYSNSRVQKFNSSGVYQSQFGSNGNGNGLFQYPQGIALDSSNNIYVVDGNNRVQKFFFYPLTFSALSLSILESQSTTYTIVLDKQPTDDVTVTLSSSSPSVGSGVSLSPSILIFTTSDWDTPQTVTVTATSDSTSDGNREVNISTVVTSDDTDFDGVTVPDISVDIVENETVNITSCSELQAMKDNLAGHYYLANDINCSGFDPDNDNKGFIPVGTESDPFTGTFNGNNHTISNLTINRPDEDYVGLFGYINGGTFQNLTLSGSVEGQGYVGALIGYSDQALTIGNISSTISVTAHASYVGGLVGYVEKDLTMTTTHVIGDVTIDSVSDFESAGGLVGYVSDNTSIDTSYYEGDVTIDSPSGYVEYVGELVGDASSNLTLISSYAKGNISVTADSYVDYIGGLIGYVNSTPSITGSYYEGDITATSNTDYVEYVGGLISYYDYDTNIVSSYVKGNISVTADGDIRYIAGLAGYSYGGSFNDTYYEGDITATSTTDYVENVGGIAGNTDDPLSLITTHAKGNITITAATDARYIGGLIGNSEYGISINTSYFTGDITATSATDDAYGIGGLIGYYNAYNSSSIFNSFAFANITGNHEIGGLMGFFENYDVYYYTATMNISNSYSIGSVSGDENVGGLVGKILPRYGSVLINDSFSASDVNGVTNHGGVLGYYTPGVKVILNNVKFDITKSGETLCASQDVDGTPGCTGVNASDATPNYFFNNNTNAPLNSWDFTNVWETRSNFYPNIIVTSLQVSPIVTTESATDRSNTNTTLNGSISDEGLSEVETRGFDYGLTDSYGTTVSENVSGTGSYALAITDLTCSTTYHYRAYATNSYATAYGNEMTFETRSCGGVSGGGGGGGGGSSSSTTLTQPPTTTT
ncbi:MAG: 6-bladed beta-propeller, partial [Candidatus Paceibacterota bacterium]